MAKGPSHKRTGRDDNGSRRHVTVVRGLLVSNRSSRESSVRIGAQRVSN